MRSSSTPPVAGRLFEPAAGRWAHVAGCLLCGWGLLVTSSSTCLWAAPVPAANPPAAVNDLDRQLLEDLSSDLLDGLGDGGRPPMKQQPGESARPQTPSPPDAPGGSDVEPPAGDDPLQSIGRRMHGVEQRIAERDTSAATQQRQREIVSDLSSLIDQLQQQCQSASSSRSQGKQAGSQTGGQGSQAADQAASNPARESTERLGTAKPQEIDSEQVRDVVKQVWGHLPERVRDLMRSATIEEFLPQYERQIEAYYRRLAEEGD